MLYGNDIANPAPELLEQKTSKENIFEQAYLWFFDFTVKCTAKDCIETDSKKCSFYPAYKNQSKWAGYTKEFREARQHMVTNPNNLIGNTCGTERNLNVPKVLAVGTGIMAIGIGVFLLQKK